MGDRYIIEMTCKKCGYVDDDVYFAPTCGFTDWECPKCGEKYDLYDETGMTYEDCSNAGLIEEIIKGMGCGG